MVGQRVHDGGWKYDVVRLEREPAWTWQGNPNWTKNPNLPPQHFSIEVDSPEIGACRFWFIRKKRGGGTLVVQPPDVRMWDREEILRANKALKVKVDALAGAFAKEHGWLYASYKGTPCRILEFESPPTPGIPKFGEPGKSLVWSDDSDEDGVNTVETRSPAHAAAFQSLPYDIDEIRARLDAHERRLDEQLEVGGRLLRLQEKTGATQGIILSALVPAAAPAPVATVPKDDHRPEVA